MKIYVVVSIKADNKLYSLFSIEPVGVYSSFERALKYLTELDNLTVPDAEVETAYDVIEYKLDEKPELLDWLIKEKDMRNQAIQDAIVDLMKRGLLDQLIGEDGHFYYTLTDLGKKATKENISDSLKDIFKKKK